MEGKHRGGTKGFHIYKKDIIKDLETRYIKEGKAKRKKERKKERKIHYMGP